MFPKRGPDFKVVFNGEDVFIEAKKIRREAEEEYFWKTRDVWVRTQTESDLDDREWNLHQRYLVTDQFPDEGWHVLVIDTSRSPQADGLLTHAWGDYCRNSASEGFPHRRIIHALVLCRREEKQHASWFNEPTTGAEVLGNSQLPIPVHIFEAFQGCFYEQKIGLLEHGTVTQGMLMAE